jgi:hypothetical protein
MASPRLVNHVARTRRVVIIHIPNVIDAINVESQTSASTTQHH